MLQDLAAALGTQVDIAQHGRQEQQQCDKVKTKDEKQHSGRTDCQQNFVTRKIAVELRFQTAAASRHGKTQRLFFSVLQPNERAVHHAARQKSHSNSYNFV